MVDTDDVISETGVKDDSITRPGKGDTLDREGLFGGVLTLLKDDIVTDNFARLEVPDANGGGGSGTEPVGHRGEGQSMDDIIGRERREVKSFGEVPEHGFTVFTTRGTERAIRGYSYGVDVLGVTNKVDTELAVGEVPDLDNLVPTGRHDERHAEVRGEADATDPFFMTIFGDGVLELTQGVPQVDGLVARSRHDLTVVGGKGNREDILGVSNETASAVSVGEVPKTESSIP